MEHNKDILILHLPKKRSRLELPISRNDLSKDRRASEKSLAGYRIAISMLIEHFTGRSEPPK